MMSLKRLSLNLLTLSTYRWLFSRATVIWGFFGLGIMIGGAIAPGKTAIAQIIPDRSLGVERSIVSPNVFSPWGKMDRIDGGAIRGHNLFHSFSDFNVNSQQRVYFSNPAIIDNIISRVTGTTPSDILGTLGVLGDANVFLINPNGIVFGPDAMLDVSGSFIASTADQVAFEDGYLYSATTANAPPVLNVHLPIAGLTNWLPQHGQIQTTGHLTVDQDLVLTAQDLDLRGGLVAGKDVRAIATHHLTATDSNTIPLTLSAGQQLLLQGNQSLELSALDHSLSHITSGGEMILRSNTPIVGDALFTAGDTIRIERLDRRLGSVISREDPVFQTAGDFAVESYTGASLQILAGGSVTIPGDIIIDAAGGPFNDSTVELSDGTSVTLRGRTEPTVDIRAGTTEFFGTPELNGSPTSADIRIGSIVNPGGTVFLTNQFQSNPVLSGDLEIGIIDTVEFRAGGTVILDSRGKITSGGIDASGGDLITFLVDGDFDALGGNGGDITLLANQDIVIPHQSFISSYGLQGGSIRMESNTAIIQEDGPPDSPPDGLSSIETGTIGNQRGGGITLSAPHLSIGGNVLVDNYGSGRGETLDISGGTLIANQASIGTFASGSGRAGTIDVEVDTLTLNERSSLGSVTLGGGGNTGKIIVNATSITAARGSQIASVILGSGGTSVTAGDIEITADAINLVGFDADSLRVREGTNFNGSAIASTVNPEAEGNSGRIKIEARTLHISAGGSVATSSFGTGNAGEINITADERVTVDGAVFPETFDGNSVNSSIQSELFTGASGEAGTITIAAPIIELTNGGSITTLSDGDGNAGSINIIATESLLVDGAVFFSQVGVDDRFSRIAVLTESAATGDAGTLTIQTPSIVLVDGGQLTAESRGTLANNAGGNIILKVNDIISMTGGSRISATAGTAGAGGDGGNITISSTFITADPNSNNDIIANAFEGRGGEVKITATSLFGLLPRSRAQLEAFLETTDPNQLDPSNLPTSDITAISQSNPSLDGIVIIRSPDVDPSRGVAELPSDAVDVSRLITQGCSAGGAIAQELGSLIVTGRGGLPPSPGEALIQPDLFLEWETVDSVRSISPVDTSAIEKGESDRAEHGQNQVESSRATSHPTAVLSHDPPSAIVEVQTLRRRADGTVMLSASTSPPPYPNSWHQSTTCVGPTP